MPLFNDKGFIFIVIRGKLPSMVEIENMEVF